MLKIRNGKLRCLNCGESNFISSGGVVASKNAELQRLSAHVYVTVTMKMGAVRMRVFAYEISDRWRQ